MFLSICGCCGVSFPINLRSFSASSGALLWEVENFAGIARSPDNTIWGYSLRKVASPSYQRRTAVQVEINSSSVSSGASEWVAKTNPSLPTQSAIACDLTKVTSSGVKTVTKSGLWELATDRDATDGTWWSDVPIVTPSTPRATLYQATDSGVARRISSIIAEDPFPIAGTIYANDPQTDSTTMTMTIPPQVLFKHASAGSNEPKWNFKRSGTTVQFPLYASAAEIETALESLPGVASVTTSGGPVCSADMQIEVTWDDPTYTFSDVWLTYTATVANRDRAFWDWSSGAPSLLTTAASYTSFTSDSTGLIRGTTWIERRDWGAASTHPWNEINSSNEWQTYPFGTGGSALTQTNERTKIGASTAWQAVPISTIITDVRNGVICAAQPRARVPVVEPSSDPFYSLCTLDEDGAIISLHDCGLNADNVGHLDTDGSLLVEGAQYKFIYQAFDGLAVPPGNSYDSTIGARNYNGRRFGSGSGTMSEAFSAEITRLYEVPLSATGSRFFAASYDSLELVDSFSWDVTFNGILSTIENRVEGNNLAVRWVDVGVIGDLPASRRESWYFFAPQNWPTVPEDIEYRFHHKNGTTIEKSTSWFSFSATESTVAAELDSWYGEGVPGAPIIFISGTVSAHSSQTQPFFQYFPLANIQIWNDVGGTVWAPRGRVLSLEIRNGTPRERKGLKSVSRTTGKINWQRNVGVAMPEFNFNTSLTDEQIGGRVCYSDSTQVVVATLCEPVLDPEIDYGDCLWEWDGTDWVLLTDNCSDVSEAVAPVDPGTTPGEQSAGTCSLL